MEFTAKEISLKLSDTLNLNLLIVGVAVIIVMTVVVVAKYLTNKQQHD
jgi:hypothetical protein